MATIQIRDVPEAVHRVYRIRAAAAGQSLQEYLRSELVENARLRSPAEIAAEVEAEILSEGRGGFSTYPAGELIRELREGG